MFELANWVWKSRPLTPGNLMSSTRQQGTSGNFCSNSSATEENNLDTRSTDRNKRPSASRSEGSSSTTRTTGVSGASICLDGLRRVTRTSSRAEADHRHDGVRAYLAALAVAGAIDYPAESSRYGSLAAAEKANFNIDTYRAANAFEGDLATRMVKAQGDAAMKAITLQTDRREAKRVASERGLRLLAVTMLGSALVFVATIAGAGPKPPTPRAIGAPRLLAIALMRLRSPERRMAATQ
jgi:hypothetical protein